ncbi:DNA N(6)-methyladenine demethylase ALKBH1D-like isoform X1 [Primulina huaijiensis]|uniref:DNA N(6)-methyladenine demethylase ALKBH1D-like isoform X1 n=1 Tax=Primulina huaijiensis TaxID=1492673 RepID=UPI003CC72CBF
MNRGGGRRGGISRRSAGHYSPVGAQLDDTSLENESGSSQVGKPRTAVGRVTQEVGGMSLRGGENVTPNAKVAQNKSPNLSGLSTKSDLSTRSDSRIQSPGVGVENCTSWESPACFSDDLEGERGKSDGKLKYSTCQQKYSPFDICSGRSASGGVKLKPSLLEKNRERKNEMKNPMEGHSIDILRPGMVLLRGFLSLPDQVKLIKTCQDLGLGCGGFYQPSYSDGAKLHLKMMCLGKNWDPETSMYSDERPVDGAKPPGIPDEFQQLVKGAIQECHTYLDSCAEVRNAKDFLPSMSPNICIVNFYATSGKLGLHQDKDESKESLHKGLPVVSFSIGDSADFLYGDERNIDKAEKVVLKSGDVLIFGGKSRHIFHGVATINSGTTPAALFEETKFRPGRLNLTFREY